MLVNVNFVHQMPIGSIIMLWSPYTKKVATMVNLLSGNLWQLCVNNMLDLRFFHSSSIHVASLHLWKNKLHCM